jgi:biopolymer transport protein ExbD
MTNKTGRKRNRPIPARTMKLWQDESAHQEVRIELLPLIDVIFCILIFFLLAAVGFSRQQAINLDLPKAHTGKSQMREMLVVSLDDLGQVYVEKEIVTKKQLSQLIKNYYQSNPNGLMALYASKNATYREVVEVLDILREVGGDRVALATLPAGAETPDNSNPYIPQLPGLPNNFNPNPAIPNIPNPPVPPTE